MPDGELEDLEKRSSISVRRTNDAELEAEIVTLRGLEVLAERVRRSGTDAKWTRLQELLQDTEDEMSTRRASAGS